MTTYEVPPSCHSKCQERDPLELSSLDKDLGFSIEMKILNAVTQLPPGETVCPDQCLCPPSLHLPHKFLPCLMPTNQTNVYRLTVRPIRLWVLV